MPTLPPGANASIPPASGAVTLEVKGARAHVDLVVLCVRADGTADGDNGVALWSQPSAASGAVSIEVSDDRVLLQLDRLPGDVQRVLVVGQADGVADLAQTGGITAVVRAGGTEIVTLDVPSPPTMPTVQIGEVYRHSSGWKVRCLGDGYAEGLAKLLRVHGIDVADEEAPVSPRPVSPVTPVGSAPARSAPVRSAPVSSAPVSSAPPVDLEKQRRVDLQKKVEATGSVSLVKSFQAAAVSLEKNGLTGVRAEVVLVLDVSGSSLKLFRQGVYQKLVERFLAAALHFDDDGVIPAYLFDTKLHEAPDITLANFQGWAHDVAARKDLWRATSYAPPIEAIARSLRRGNGVPTYVAFVTDGGNQDRKQASQAIRDASALPAFFQFMAIGREGDFPFLHKLDELSGRVVDNAGFFAVADPAALTDDEFYGKIMIEFPLWLTAAKGAGVLG